MDKYHIILNQSQYDMVKDALIYLDLYGPKRTQEQIDTLKDLLPTWIDLPQQREDLLPQLRSTTIFDLTE
jgi:hypothetical protein